MATAKPALLEGPRQSNVFTRHDHRGDSPLDAEAIVRKSLDIAADICVYTNRNVTIETLKDA